MPVNFVFVLMVEKKNHHILGDKRSITIRACLNFCQMMYGASFMSVNFVF